MRNNILNEITMVQELSNRNAQYVLNDVLESNILDTNTKVKEALDPEELVCAITGLLYDLTKRKKNRVEEVKYLVEEFLLNDSDIDDEIDKGNLTRADIGVALLKLGADMLVFETIAEAILETDIENGTARVEDIEELRKAKFVHIDDEIIEKIEALDKKSKEVKVEGDKDVLIKLIKDRAISDNVIYELLLSKFITIKELSDTLPGDRFDEILKIVDPDYEVEKKVEKDSCGGKCKSCSCGSSHSLLEFASKLKEALTKEAKEGHISTHEAQIRNRIKDGLMPDEEIAKALVRGQLNPFFLETIDVIDEERLTKIALLAREQMPFRI